MIGAVVRGTRYDGCVFDTVERKWVSNVCLSVHGKSFTFDPVYMACLRFREFVIPWALSAYKPSIKPTTKLPILTFQVSVQKREET